MLLARIGVEQDGLRERHKPSAESALQQAIEHDFDQRRCRTA
jgi:hypothetical protein